MSAARLLPRFEGTEGKGRLVELLERQTLVAGERELADAIASTARLVEFASGEVLMEQGSTDNGVMFLLTGAAVVTINGREAARREAGTHVGDMAAIDSAVERTAQVTAQGSVVAAVLDEQAFREVSGKFPEVWPRLARDLATRLRQRDRFFRPPNLRPPIFIGCSSETLPVGEALRDHFRGDDVSIQLWTDGVFRPGEFTLESLLAEIERSDFAVLLLNEDDVLEVRGERATAPRDNVVFELGLFMGQLGRGRALSACPAGVDLRVPPDLLGLTHMVFETTDAGAASERLATGLREAMGRLGVR